MLDDGQVVGDEDVGEAELALEAGEEVEDLGLDGFVEGADGFVEDDEAGLEGEGAGDVDALFLAAGELVGVAGAELGGVEADAAEAFVGLEGGLAAGAAEGRGVRRRRCRGRAFGG